MGASREVANLAERKNPNMMSKIKFLAVDTSKQGCQPSIYKFFLAWIIVLKPGIL